MDMWAALARLSELLKRPEVRKVLGRRIWEMGLRSRYGLISYMFGFLMKN